MSVYILSFQNQIIGSSLHAREDRQYCRLAISATMLCIILHLLMCTRNRSTENWQNSHISFLSHRLRATVVKHQMETTGLLFQTKIINQRNPELLSNYKDSCLYQRLRRCKGGDFFFFIFLLNSPRQMTDGSWKTNDHSMFS